MLKKRKQIIRLLEDVAIHLAIFLVLFGLAGLSFMIANHTESRAASVNFSVTITDPNAPAEEPVIGSPYDYEPPSEAPTNITVFTLTPEDDESIMSDRGDGTAGLTKKFMLWIDPQDTTYPSQTQISISSNLSSGEFSLDGYNWLDNKLLAPIPSIGYFDFSFRLKNDHETLHRLFGDSESFNLIFYIEETPTILGWTNLAFSVLIYDDHRQAPPPPPAGPLPFYDEAFEGRRPSLLEKIIAPIREILKPLIDTFFGTEAEAKEPGQPKVTIDESMSRLEIYVPLPPKSVIINKEIIGGEHLPAVTAVTKYLLDQGAGRQIKEANVFVTYLDRAHMAEIAAAVASHQPLALTPALAEALRQGETLPIGTLILKADVIEEERQPVNYRHLDGHNGLLVEIIRTQTGQELARLVPEGTQSLVIIKPQDILRAIKEGAFTAEEIVALDQTPTKNRLIIPLAPARYPRFNLLLVIAGMLAFGLATHRYHEYKRYEEAYFQKRLKQLKKKH